MNYTPMTRKEVLDAFSEGLITNWERRYLLRIARRAWLKKNLSFANILLLIACASALTCTVLLFAIDRPGTACIFAACSGFYVWAKYTLATTPAKIAKTLK